jgi:lysophospholipase L1-like esterase
MIIRNKIVGFGLAFIILAASLMAVIYIHGEQIKTSRSSLIRVGCLGDSITGTEEYSFVGDLQALLGGNYTVGNFGISGATVLRTSFTPYIYQPQIQMAHSFEPNIVVIMLGTNDARTDYYQAIDNFVGDYTTLIKQVQQFESKPKIFLVIPPPLYNNNLSLSGTDLVNGVIPRIKLVAANFNLPLIDVNAVFANHPEYLVDGVHPNSSGKEVIAEQIFRAINQSTFSR